VTERGPWTIVRDADRHLALGGGDVNSFAALDLPRGSAVWLHDDAWDDGARLQVSLRYRVLPGSVR
jgi:hypothetical protein